MDETTARRALFERRFNLGRFPRWTCGAIVAQVLLFLCAGGGTTPLAVDELIAWGARTDANILELGQTWRLLSANVLHRDGAHLLFNMFYLFNVGGTCENAYRPADYLLIVLAAAVGTTTCATLFADVPSLGGSGVVIGLFGATTVFAYKYAGVLPERYRRLFFGAVVPYTVFILYAGLMAPDTDNWGHLGGLLGGALAALPLQPALLYAPRRKWSYSALAAALLIVAVLGAGPLLRAFGPQLLEVADDASGLQLALPTMWSPGQNHLGYAAFGNELGASVGVATKLRVDRPRRVGELSRLFLSEELEPLARQGEIRVVHVGAVRPVTIDGALAVELPVVLDSRAGRHQTFNLLIERGRYNYYVVLSVPLLWAHDYAPLLERLRAAVVLGPPADLRRAERVVAAMPHTHALRVQLAEELALIGAADVAALHLRQVLAALPDQRDALLALGRLALDYGHEQRSVVEMLRSAQHNLPADVELAAVTARLHIDLGDLQGARHMLLAALAQRPRALELRRLLIDLED